MRALILATFLVGALQSQTAFRPLHVSAAGIIVDDSNKPVVLHGLNRNGGDGAGTADATATDQDYAAQNQLLSMNLVRIWVNAASWNSNLQVPAANMAYQAYIDQLIQRSKKYGNYVLIVCAAQDLTGNHTDVAFTFWAAFAKQYAADPAILYDTAENMHSEDNNTWSDDQNALIAAIRDENPQALIFVEDIDSPNQTFESIVAGTLPDLAWPNIVWNFHLYNGSSGSCSEPQSRRAVNWPFNIDPLVVFAHQQGHAAAITEWGGCNDNEPFHTNITTYAQIRSMPLAYFDNTNLITNTGGMYQLTAIGSKVAQAYTALGAGGAVPGNQLTPLAHTVDAPSFKTTVILTNPGTSAAPYTLQFVDESGNVPASPVALELGSLEGTIPAGNSATIRTAGTGSYLGWGHLTASASAAGSVIYSQKNQLPSLQEGTTNLAPAGSQHFFAPFDNTSGAATGMALTNPGPAAANITVTLRYSDGTSETPSFPALSSHSHESFAIPTQFPNTNNRSGVAEFVASSPLFTVVFRFNPTGAFTALDVVSAGGASTMITRTLTHAVDAPSFQTTVLLTNTGTQAASYLLQFNNEQGNAPSPPVALTAGSSLTGNIPAGQSVTIQTARMGPYLGWAQLTAPASVGGSVIYSQKNQLPSLQEGTATIVSTGTQHFFLPFDNTNGAATAMALTNSGMSAANITVTLRYSDGTSETPSFPALASGNHESFSIPVQFPNAANRRGVAEFTCSSPVYAIAFRFNPTLAFTAFGIVPD
jgi:hypothetical protein